MGWALDGGEDIGGLMAEYDYLAEHMGEVYEDRNRREDKLKGKYLIICKSRYNGNILYLQDRNVSKKGFWTKFLSNAIGFTSESAAKEFCSTLKYNRPKVIRN